MTWTIHAVRREVSIKSPSGLGLVVLVVAGTLAFPVVANRVRTATVRDDPACPHSGDLPESTGSLAARGEILCLLNKERGQFGLVPLLEEARLDAAAQRQSDDMARRHFFAHVNPDAQSPAQRIAAAGYPRSTATGENIAWGEEMKATPVEIVDGWMHSPGHRENILRSAFTRIGIGVTRGAPQSGVHGRAVLYATTFGGEPLGR